MSETTPQAMREGDAAGLSVLEHRGRVRLRPERFDAGVLRVLRILA